MSGIHRSSRNWAQAEACLRTAVDVEVGTATLPVYCHSVPPPCGISCQGGPDTSVLLVYCVLRCTAQVQTYGKSHTRVARDQV